MDESRRLVEAARFTEFFSHRDKFLQIKRNYFS